MIPKTLSLAVSASTLLAATLAWPAVKAQDEGGTVVLEELLVTARKRSESIQDVPLSVTSIGKELKSASIRRLEDIQSFTPNVYIRNTSGIPGGAAISIRGVSYQETDKSYDPSIGVIMDGMYLGTSSGSLLQNFDTKRVEVLRGPQGTLFGKNTTGGVISIIRGDVTMEWGGDFSITLGDDGREDKKGILNVPLIDEKLGVKLFGNQIESDGWIRNTTLKEDVGGDDKQTYGFTALWSPTTNVDVKFHYEKNKDKTDTGAWANKNQPEDLNCVLEGDLWLIGCEATDSGSDKDHVSSDIRNRNDSEYDSYILTANWGLGSVLLTSITAQRYVDEHNLSGFDASPAQFLYLDYFNKWEQFSQELRLTSQIFETIEVVAGLYYWDVDYEQRWDVGQLHYTLDQIGAITGVPGGAGFPSEVLHHNGQNQETASYAAFASGDWELSEQWTITAGWRWTYEEKDFKGSDGAFYADNEPHPELSFREFEDDWSENSLKLGFKFRYSSDVMVFGSYGEGFKSGGFIGRQANFPDGFDPSYDPETVGNWELGMKSTWLDGQIVFNPSIFYSQFRDKQEDLRIPISLSSIASVVENASKLDIFGVELELQFQVTEAWNIRASYGYLDSEYDNYVADVNGDGIETDNSGRIPRNTPENTFGLSTSYALRVGPGELIGFAAFRWRDEVETIADNDPLGHLDSISNLDLTLNYLWNDDRYRLTAYARNITDEREVNVTRFEGLVAWGQWSQGSNYGVEFAVSF